MLELSGARTLMPPVDRGDTRPQPMARPLPRICVVGIGSAGSRAVTRMMGRGLVHVDFITIDSDGEAAGDTPGDWFKEDLVTINRSGPIDRGRHGGLREEGSRSARRSLQQIREALDGAEICFIAAGLGGRTASGAAPVIASAAREMGILTVALVTRPFDFEGGRRLQAAEIALWYLRRTADTVITVQNQSLLLDAGDRHPARASLAAADDVLENGIRSITDLIARPAIVGVDLADIRAVLGGTGSAFMSSGEGSGPHRATQAAERAATNPLLEGRLQGARTLLLSIVGGNDMQLAEIDEAAQNITSRIHPDAEIIWGSAHDPELEDRMRVSVTATGLDGDLADRATSPGPRRRAAVAHVECRSGRHEALPPRGSNQGFHFSNCRHCGQAVIRSGERWHSVPPGFRVVWRKAGERPGSPPPGGRAAKPAASARPRPGSPWMEPRIFLTLLVSHWLDCGRAWREAVRARRAAPRTLIVRSVTAA